MTNPDGSISVSERLNRIESRLDMLVALQTEAAGRANADLLRFENHDRRIDELEGWARWGGRIVLALVLTAVISTVLIAAS